MSATSLAALLASEPIDINLHQAGGGPISSSLAAIIGGAVVAVTAVGVEFLRQRHDRSLGREERESRIVQAARAVHSELVSAFVLIDQIDSDEQAEAFTREAVVFEARVWESFGEVIALLPGEVWKRVQAAYLMIGLYNSSIEISQASSEPSNEHVKLETFEVLTGAVARGANALSPYLDADLPPLVPGSELNDQDENDPEAPAAIPDDL